MQQLQALCSHEVGEEVHSGHISARSVETGDEAERDRVGTTRENDWYCGCCSFGCLYRRSTARRGNHSHLALNQIARHCRQPIVLTLCPTVFDGHVPVLDIAGFTQALKERGQVRRPPRGRGAIEKSDHRHRRPLRARHARRQQRRCRGAGQRDELAPPHSITSSAMASTPDGTSMPSARAVCRLMTNSNLVDCSTGRSAGLAPLRILPV